MTCRSHVQTMVLVVQQNGRTVIAFAAPTIVLVHGAFADSSNWRAIHDALRADGRRVAIPPNPLRGLASDAGYIAAVAAAIDGSVLLVGHCYGGAVVTVAGVAKNVVGLVYVAGFAPDEGETLGGLQGRFAAPPIASHLKRSDAAIEGEMSIDEAMFAEVYAADLDPADAAFLAIAQRPLSVKALEEPAGAAAWRSKKSWAVLPTGDAVIHPDLQRFAFARAGARVTEVPGASHAVIVSRPRLVATVINDALVACQAIPS